MPVGEERMSMNFDQARFNMVEQQVRPWEVLDEQVLRLFESTHREDFVPVRYRKMAFADLAIPLAHDQCMMKPVVEGRLLQALVKRSLRSAQAVGSLLLAWHRWPNGLSVLMFLRVFLPKQPEN